MSAVRVYGLRGPTLIIRPRRTGDFRFSGMLFLGVRGFSAYAGPTSHSRLAWLSCRLPPLGNESASCTIGFSKLNSPTHRYLCLRFKNHLTMSPAKLEAGMDSLFSFPIRLFRPLQHAGLSRRSPRNRSPGAGADSFRIVRHPPATAKIGVLVGRAIELRKSMVRTPTPFLLEEGNTTTTLVTSGCSVLRSLRTRAH